eukprot:4159439-Prymnesium_polylepis.1
MEREQRILLLARDAVDVRVPARVQPVLFDGCGLVRGAVRERVALRHDAAEVAPAVHLDVHVRRRDGRRLGRRHLGLELGRCVVPVVHLGQRALLGRLGQVGAADEVQLHQRVLGRGDQRLVRLGAQLLQLAAPHRLRRRAHRRDRARQLGRHGLGVARGLSYVEPRGLEHKARVAVELKLGKVEPHRQVPRLVVEADHLRADRPRRRDARRVEVRRVLPPAVRVNARELDGVVLDHLRGGGARKLERPRLGDGGALEG